MATYTRKFVEPYPGQGYIDKPNTSSPVIAQHLNNFVLTFKSLEDFAVANSLTPNPEDPEETIPMLALQIGNDVYTFSSSSIAKLEDLENVEISLPTDGQVLKYDAANNKWVNADESGGGGGGDAIKVILTKAEYDLLPSSKETDGKLYFITDWVDTSVANANQISYDNTSSSMSATNLQSALDELVSMI